MNSNYKHHEIEESKGDLLKKIAFQIRAYSMRKIVAQDEIADLSKCMHHNYENFEALQIWQDRNAFLKQEIEFCNKQISAYQNNDHKSKIIPDRLL